MSKNFKNMVISHCTADGFELEVSFMADVGINRLRKQKSLFSDYNYTVKQLYTIALFGLLLIWCVDTFT